MPLKFSKEIIEVAIVTGDPERSLAFYRDFLGFPYLKEIRFPGGCYHRLAIGESVLKIVFLEARGDSATSPSRLKISTRS